ncbi:MAG: CHC2 zinc finger domain-containing protein [Candidatus Tenebribacter mawsonii]|nr:CHC2 zinc finger domain-containing protein [Candidatus Tenebribacter mawsonii]
MKHLDKIKQEINIIDLANHFSISVKNNKAICPFHEDTNASLTFYPKTDSFHCFGCSASGSVIDLTMRMQHKNFIEAVNYLEDLYHITETETHKKTKIKDNKAGYSKLKIQTVYQYFFDIISLTDKGKKYMQQRGLSDSTINKFRIKSIDEPNKVFRKLKQQFDNDVLKKAGLIGTSKKGNDYFVFWQPAIIFTHFKDGSPVYFSSRNLIGDIKSYKLNGIKQKYYYAFNDEKNIYIFESIIDGLSNYELFGDGFISINGINSLRIKNYNSLITEYPDKNIVFAFDNDEAGINKTLEFKNEIENLSHLNWHCVFDECNIEPCKDMNEVLVQYRKKNNQSLQLNQLNPEQREDFEERAAIMEFEGGLSKERAEQKALLLIQE